MRKSVVQFTIFFLLNNLHNDNGLRDGFDSDEIEKKALPLKRVYNIPTHCFFEAASAKKPEKGIEEILPQPLRPKNTEIITVCKAGIRSKCVSNLLA